MLEDLLRKRSPHTEDKLARKIMKIAGEFFFELTTGQDLGLITVTDVKVTRGKYYTRIWVSFSKLTPDNGKQLQGFLTKCEFSFRKYLSRKLDVFKVPEIEFILDETLLHVKRIDE